jgi:hypothetical protein
MIAGGFTNERDLSADDQVSHIKSNYFCCSVYLIYQAVLESVKSQVELKTNKTFSRFEGTSCRTQVVAGLNYLFKVQTNQGELALKVHKPLPHTGQPAQLMSVSEHGFENLFD